jgi:hypothetical protein
MRIVELAAREGYKLFVRYEDGVAGEVDLSALVGQGVFAAWLQPGIFERVRLTEAGAPEWPEDVDLCPDALYLDLTGKSAEDIFPNLRRIQLHA